MDEVEVMKILKDWGFLEDFIIDVLVEIDNGYGLGKALRRTKDSEKWKPKK